MLDAYASTLWYIGYICQYVYMFHQYNVTYLMCMPLYCHTWNIYASMCVSLCGGTCRLGKSIHGIVARTLSQNKLIRQYNVRGIYWMYMPVHCSILDTVICQYVWYIGYICQYVLCGQIDQLHEEAGRGGILTALSETFPTRSLAVPVPRCKPSPNPPVDTAHWLTRPAS